MECSLELLERGLLVALQDLGAAGLTSAASEMASKGGGRRRHRRRARAAARAGHGAVRDHGLRVAGADALRRRARALDAVLAVCEHWETAAAAIGEVTDSGLVRVLDGGRVVGEMPVAALVDECPLYELDPRRAERAALPAAGAGARLRGPRRGAARAAALAEHRRPPAAVRAVRLRSCSRAPCAAPAQADAAVLALPERDGADARRSRSRSTATARRVAADPYRGTRRGGARVRREPRLRRRRAARADQLPELRQPREAAHRLAADRVACAGSATPAARSGSRSSAATSRSTTRAPTARSTRRRSSAWSASCPTSHRAGRLGFRAEGDRIALVGVFAPDIRGSELARLGGAELPDARCPNATSRASARPSRRSATPCARGALASAHDIAEGGLATALAECCLAGGLGAEVVPRRHGQAAARAVRRGARRLRRHRRRLRAARARRARPAADRRLGQRQPADDRRRRGADRAVARACCARRTARWLRCSTDRGRDGCAGSWPASGRHW